MAENSDHPNIIFVVLDTMRKDSIGVYNDKMSTPNIDRFASSASIYDRAISAAPWTLPSHMSFLTGLYPSEHNVDVDTFMETNLNTEKKLRNIYLPKVLSEVGYNTIGISSNNMISKEFGFHHGFDTFMSIRQKPTVVPDSVSKLHRSYGSNGKTVALNLLKKGKIKQLYNFYRQFSFEKKYVKIMNFPKVKGADRILDVLDSISLKSPFFLFINFMEMHEPYESTSWGRDKIVDYSEVEKLDFKFELKDLQGKERELINKTYYNQSYFMDQYFGKLVSFLKERDLYDESLIILLSDHGQSLAEQNWIYHGRYLYDELLDIPLIIKYPTQEKPERFDGSDGRSVSLTDLHQFIKSYSIGQPSKLNPRDVVFSESHESTKEPRLMAIDSKPYKQKSRETWNDMVSPKKAVYKDGFKLVVDGMDGQVVQFTLFNEEVDMREFREKAEELLEELDIFCGNEEFTIPNNIS